MNRVTAALAFVISFLFLIAQAMAGRGLSTDDVILRKAIQAYQMEPHRPAGRNVGPKELMGQALFFDPIVSGPKKITCSTCHIRRKGAGDDLRMAIGLGAKGVSKERLATKSAFMVPRNALPFFNRGSDDFVALFWDGRVQRGADGVLETPLGKKLPKGFESALAAAAVFPLAEPDEMLGHSLIRGSPSTYHGELVTVVDEVSTNYQERTLVVFDNVIERLFGTKSSNQSQLQSAYRALFTSAYPSIPIEGIRISHLGNALAAFIGAAFELKQAPWDRYVEGDTSALSLNQKKGAIIFFGKGRCAVCHSGKQFSDFKFHGLAVPQLGVGKHARHIDYGRAAATSRGEDRFSFRTPPLRNVTETAPWGHSGVFPSLHAVIEHHINPVPKLYEVQKRDPGEAAHAGRLLAFRSPILAEISPLSGEEIKLLIEFLGALASATVMPDSLAIPSSVPSGAKGFLQ